ncbi:ribonuclease H-like domain-containing protein [Tanacetum coccineum]
MPATPSPALWLSDPEIVYKMTPHRPTNKQGVESSNSVRRQKSKDTKSKNRVLKNTNAKSSTTHVQKVSRSVSIDSNQCETMNSTLCHADKSVLNTKNVTVVNDGLNIVCVSYGKDVFLLSHEKCIARYDLSRNSNVKRALFTTPLVLWIVDSGCSKHMTSNIQLLRYLVEKFIGTIHFGNDHFTTITGYGDYVQGNLMICHVYYVQGLEHNLFSVRQFCDGDLKVAFHLNMCYGRILESDDLLTGSRNSNLYTISISEMVASSPVCLMSRATSTKSWLWHRMLSYLYFGTINQLTSKDLVDGLPKFKYNKDHLCSACKQVIVDDYSRYTWVYFLCTKDEAPDMIIDFVNQVQRNLKAQILTIRTHNGTEYKNEKLLAFYAKLGIVHQTSIARTTQQNGVVERQNRTLVEAARTMLIFSKALKFLWAEVIAIACFTQNCSIVHTWYNKIPYELILERKPNIQYFHVFGSLCYLTNDRNDHGKMKSKAGIGIFIGYSESSRGFHMASECNNLEPGMNCTNFQDSSKDSQSIPSKSNIDNLFGPLYEEYYATSSQEVSDNSTANTLDNEHTSSSSSIIVEEDEAPQIVSSSAEQVATEPNSPVLNENAMNSFKKTLQILMEMMRLTSSNALMFGNLLNVLLVSKDKEIDKLMALISLSFKKIYKPTNNNLRTSSNTSRANQDNSPRINRGTGYDNQRAFNVAGARENKPKRVKDAAYHKEKMLLCKQEKAGVQLNAKQADWKDDTDDESDDQELEAHYMFMVQVQEITPDQVDNYGPIFDDEPMHKVEIDCAKAKGDLMSYKIDFEKSSNAYTQKINDLNQTISDMKKELCAHQETISIMSQAKEAQIKLYKTREDKELDKVIALENKVKCKEKINNDKSFKENQSNVFLKEREQYVEIQDLKAQLQDKGIAISELKKLIGKMKGKSVETKFEKSSVIRQPNAFKSQRQSILGNASRTANFLEHKTPKCSTMSNTPLSSNSFAARTDNSLMTTLDSTTPIPNCLMAKATLSEAWLWHRHLSHLNFDTINLLSKNNIVNGLLKLKFVRDHLCSSYELGKAKKKRSIPKGLTGWDDSEFSIFTPKSEEVEGRPLFHKFTKADGMKAVPPPLFGNYIPLSDTTDLDETQMIYGKKSTCSIDSISVSNDFVSCDNNDKSSEIKSNDYAFCVSSVNSSEPMTANSSSNASTSSVSTHASEDNLESSEGTTIQEPIIVQELPSFSCTDKDVKTSRTPCNKNGYFNKKASYFRKNNSSASKEPIWDNATRVTQSNQFIPHAVLLRSGKVSIPAARPNQVPAGRPKPVSTGKQNRPPPVHAGRRNSSSVTSGWWQSTARPMTHLPTPTSSYFQTSTPVGPHVYYNQMHFDGDGWATAVKPSTGCSWKSHRNKVYRVNLHTDARDEGIVDSGCSRTMTGNKERLDDFQPFKGGKVTFGGAEGSITGKGTIRTPKLDFENVYYMKELQQFNLFSVSQICDKKNRVLFTDTDCLVLSNDFKLPDESMVLLRVPRKHNLYTFNLNNLAPKENLACLVAKASSDEAVKWHRRMGHVNYKNMNKLVKDNLVRGLPPKLFKNDHTCVACCKGKQHKATYKAITAQGWLMMDKGIIGYKYCLLVVSSSRSSTVLGQLTYLVTSLTLDSARTYVMQGAPFTQGTIPSIPISSSISPEGVPLGPVFLLGLLVLAIDAACAFRAEEMPSLISCWMAAKVMAGVSDVDVLLGGIPSTKDNAQGYGMTHEDGDNDVIGGNDDERAISWKQ